MTLSLTPALEPPAAPLLRSTDVVVRTRPMRYMVSVGGCGSSWVRERLDKPSLSCGSAVVPVRTPYKIRQFMRPYTLPQKIESDLTQS
jgi:hypothetical protein